MAENYTSIENPYDAELNREEDAVGSPVLTQESVPEAIQAQAAADAEETSSERTFQNLWIGSWIKSSFYKPGKSGFMLDGKTGKVEIGDGYFRGDITGATGTFNGSLVAGSIDIPNTTTDDSFHVNSSGDSWWGCDPLAWVASHDSAKAYITKTGSAKFQEVVISGNSTINDVPVAQVANAATATAESVPVNLACPSSSITVASDGTVSTEVVLSWTAIATDTFDHYVVRYKKAAATYYNYLSVNTNTITIEGLVPNTAYNFGVAAVNKYGTSSSFSSDINETTPTSSTPPATVAGVSAVGGIQYVILEWTANAEKDLASYNIYRHTANDSAAATLIGSCRTTYFIDGGRTGGTPYYYWVKALNTSGLISQAFSTVISATPRNVENGDIDSTVTIAANKILIDGTTYLSNWRHGSDMTKIDGGKIYANSVTTAQLNFTPVDSSNIIASINASEEGITITADHITLQGSTTFIAEASALGIPKVFYAQPTTPYRVGDLWIDGTVLRRCITELLTGAYNAAHWGLAVAYTDDTVANTKVSTFVQTTVPTALAAGDLWIDSDDNNKLYRATNIGDNEIKAGEWVAVVYNDTGKIATGGAAADVNAGVTTINGGKITAGSIYADQIHSSYMSAIQINASQINAGTISGWTINGSTITGGTVQTATSGKRVVMASDVLRGYDGSTTYPNFELNGGTLYWSDGSVNNPSGGDVGAHISFDEDYLELGSHYHTNWYYLRIYNSGQVIIGDGSTWITVGEGGGYDGTNLIPDSNNTYNLGSSTYKFADAFVAGTAYFSGKLKLPVGTNLY